MPKQVEVLQEVTIPDDHALAGTHPAGTILEVGEDLFESIAHFIEQGFMKLVEPSNTNESSSEESSESAAEEGAEKTDGEEPSDEKAPAEQNSTVVAPVTPAAPAAPAKPAAPTTAEKTTADLAASFPTPPVPFESYPSMVYAFGRQVEKHEACFGPGEDPRYPHGTRAFLNKNPGNLKFRHQPGAIAEDKDSFAVFDSMDDGFKALLDLIQYVAQGKSPMYKLEIFDPVAKATRQMNFLDFFKIYDSSHGDNPEAYAVDVAAGMGVPVDTTIKQLLG